MLSNEKLLSVSDLIKPISLDNPVGIDCRSIDEYLEIKQLRQQAREAEQQTLWDENQYHPNLSLWKNILVKCIDVLKTKSKDIDIAVWFLESKLRLNGFQGFSEGLQLLQELISTYWPMIYPNEDEEGLSSKLISIAGLNGESNYGTLIAPIYCTPLNTDQTEIYSAWHFQQAELAEQQGSSSKLTYTRESILLAMTASGRNVVETLEQNIKDCLHHYQHLCHTLDEKVGKENSPPSSRIIKALTDCQQILQQCIKSFPEVKTASLPNYEQMKHNPTEPQTSIEENREQMLEQLQKISDYFAAHEPLSPVPFLLERAKSWSELSLPELLKKLIPDPDSLIYSYKLLGIEDKQLNESDD